MIKIENTETYGFESAVRVIRNVMNPSNTTDSRICHKDAACHTCQVNRNYCGYNLEHDGFVIGYEDMLLMMQLCAVGGDYCKIMRNITVSCDITAPIYWWKEFNTYTIGMVEDSYNGMREILDKKFTLDDFSYEHLMEEADNCEIGVWWGDDGVSRLYPTDVLETTIDSLNACRKAYLETKDKKYWWQMIQLLPSSYNQKRTVPLNYEMLRGIYNSRRGDNLDEWNDFCKWIKKLPYSKLIIGHDDKWK